MQVQVQVQVQVQSYLLWIATFLDQVFPGDQVSGIRCLAQAIYYQSRCQEQVPGAGARSRCQEQVPGAGARSRCQEQVPGAGARSRCQEQVPGAGGSPGYIMYQVLHPLLVGSQCVVIVKPIHLHLQHRY